MNSLIPYIWAAGAIHLVIAGANFFLPTRLHYRENMAGVSPILRQISIIHWVYLVGVLLLFSALCLFFAPQLTGASPLGRFLSGALAIFWLSRCAIQIFYYDAQLRRQNRFADTAFLIAFFFMGCVFAAAAAGGLR